MVSRHHTSRGKDRHRHNSFDPLSVMSRKGKTQPQALNGVETSCPRIPQIGLSNEVLVYLVAVTHLLSQNFNIYRTNLDSHNIAVLAIGLLCLARRLITKLVYSMMWPDSDNSYNDRTKSIRHISSSSRRFPLLVLAILTALFVVLTLLVTHFVLHTPWLGGTLWLISYPVVAVGVWAMAQRLLLTSQLLLSETANRWTIAIIDVIYWACECGFVAGFLPVRFIRTPSLYYNRLHCVAITVFAASSSLVLLASSLLLRHGSEIFELALYWGHWTSVDSSTEKPARVLSWSPQAKRNPSGSYVNHRGRLFVSDGGDHNLSEPGCVTSTLIYIVYHFPIRTHGTLLTIQSSGIVLVCYFLLQTSRFGVWMLLLHVHAAILIFALVVWRVNKGLLQGIGLSPPGPVSAIPS